MSVAILDLGYGNVGSVRSAFQRLGAAAELTNDPRRIAAAPRLVIPGVGSAGHAMERLAELGLTESVRSFPRPLLGICLGMQLLFERSEEGRVQCLGLIPGRVRRLKPSPTRAVPHMGWSALSSADPRTGLRRGDYLWFAHSFACGPGPHATASADHGGPFAAAVERDNLLGCQFHPERSSAAGARFLKAFLER